MTQPEPTLHQLIQRYLRLESALVYDVLDTMGLPHQQLALAMQPLDRDMVVAGPAFTSKAAVSEAAARVGAARLAPPGADDELLAELYPGCVLVQDVGNDPVSGGLGENLGLSVQLAG